MALTIDTTVITNAGLAAVLSAQSNGPKINITNFKIGQESLINSSTNDLIERVNVASQVYQGIGGDLEYNAVDSNTFEYRIVLAETIGNFTIGNIGLFLEDGTLFAICALANLSTKFKTNPVSGVIGNRLEFRLLIKWTNQQNNTDFTVITEYTPIIPSVQLVTDLPAISSSINSIYHVSSYPKLGGPILAIKNIAENKWDYIGGNNSIPSVSSLSNLPLASSTDNTAYLVNTHPSLPVPLLALKNAATNSWTIFDSSKVTVSNINILDYGAVADGETNCFTAWTNAYNDTPEGGTLYIPGSKDGEAVYLMSGVVGLTISKNINLICDPNATIKFDNENATYLRLSNVKNSIIQFPKINGGTPSTRSNNAAIYVFNGCNNISIIGARINNVAGGGILCENSSDIRILYPYIKNTLADGVHITNGSTGPSKKITVVAPICINTGDDSIAVVSYKAASWASTTTYAAGAKVSNGNYLYTTTAGGTSGSTAPTHTSGSASDGGVTWAYAGSINLDLCENITITGAISENSSASGLTISGGKGVNYTGVIKSPAGFHGARVQKDYAYNTLGNYSCNVQANIIDPVGSVGFTVGSETFDSTFNIDVENASGLGLLYGSDSPDDSSTFPRRNVLNTRLHKSGGMGIKFRGYEGVTSSYIVTEGCGNQGIVFAEGTNMVVNSIFSKNNGQSSTNSYDNIFINGASNLTIGSIVSIDDQSPTTILTPLRITNATNIVINSHIGKKGNARQLIGIDTAGGPVSNIKVPDTDVTFFGADTTGTVNSRDAFEANRQTIYNTATSMGTYIPANIIRVPFGRYKMDSNFRIDPWIKLKTLSPVELDFTGMSNSANAIKVSVAGAPTLPGTWSNGRKIGPFPSAVLNGVDGVLSIIGPGTSGSSIGVSVGNESDIGSGIQYDARDIMFSNINVSDFYNILRFNKYDTYLSCFNDCVFSGGTVCVMFQQPAGTSSNSGENMKFFNCTFGSCDQGIVLDASGYDLVFNGCSLDYLRDFCLKINTGINRNRIVFDDCHIENCYDVGGFISTISSPTVSVGLNNCRMVVANNGWRGISGTRSDGGALARIPLFQGPMNLTLNNVAIAGYENHTITTNGLFLCDASVNVISASGVRFSGYKQIISRSSILNHNWKFSDTTVSNGATLDFGSVPGWIYDNGAANFSGTISNTYGFDGSTLSLKVSRTGSSSGWYRIISEEATPITALDRLASQLVIRAPSTTGTLSTTMLFRGYRKGRTLPATVTGATFSGSTVRVVTGTPHNLQVGHIVTMVGANQAEYNGRKIVTNVDSTTQFRYYAPSTTASTATGTLSYTVEDLIPTSLLAGQFNTFSTYYNDTTDPYYTGNRDVWAKARDTYPAASTVPQFDPGVTHVRLIIEIAGLNDGDSVYVGAGIMAKA